MNPDLPLVSVLMPVYNAGKFLRESLESILNQTYNNFEFIIVNDGSTDNSENIIKTYSDNRIKYYSNSRNKGLIFSLNYGIDLAKGEYLARMDADDISMRDRFEKQIAFLEQNENVSAVFANVRLIDKSGTEIGIWEDDINTKNYSEIRRTLAKTNCLAHPTLMIRKSVISIFKYKKRRLNSEDWDLWLRLVSRNYQIEKINEPLLNYRIHDDSVTFKRNRNGSDIKILTIQSKYLLSEATLFRVNKFNLRVLKYALKNIDKIFFYSFISKTSSVVKKRMRSIYFPFYPKFKFIKLLKKRKIGKINILYIIPHMVLGGADKVNLDIISNLDRSIFSIHIITTSDEDNIWLSRFEPITDNIFQLPQLFEERFHLKFILFLIKKLKINLVFLSNSFMGYSSLPQIKRFNKKIKVVDLMHGEGGKHEGGGVPLFSSKFDEFIDRRIVISNYLQKYITSKFNINPGKIEVITNGINTDHFNNNSFSKNTIRQELNIKESDIVISYVGRLEVEKHPENVILLADHLKNRGYLNYKYIITGNGTQYDHLKLLTAKLKVEDIVKFLGYKEDVRPILKDTDILYLCSEAEGIPLIILEAMAMKIPVISSNVGGVSELIEENKNGFLVNFDENFIENCAEKIVILSRKEMEEIGENNRNKAAKVFSLNTTVEKYNKLFYNIIFSNDNEY